MKIMRSLGIFLAKADPETPIGNSRIDMLTERALLTIRSKQTRFGRFSSASTVLD